MKYKDLTAENFIEEIKQNYQNWDFERIKLALDFAEQAHNNQNRKSGEKYIIHPIHVAYILSTLEVDTDTIIAGLLHDVLEDTDYDYEFIQQKFGKHVASLVEGVTKLLNYEYKSEQNSAKLQADNFSKLLLSISNDFRVILIKLADRLHNMRTLQFMDSEKRERIARETLDIYAPLANRFGIAKIKWELEDLCLKFLYPEDYKKIINIVDLKKDDREKYIIDFIKFVKDELNKQNITTEVNGRTKHFYSIYRKNKVREIPYDEIFDLAAIRIIVETEEECYRILGIVQSICDPVGRYRNYIAQPKPNGYQSLHITVLGPKGRKVEIQIRTKNMHSVAEDGIAAHWKYKEFSGNAKKGQKKDSQNNEMQQTIQTQKNWIQQILKKYNDGEIDDFVDYLKFDLYSEIIITITPNGDLIKLPMGSTPVDFAFAIHSEVGLHTSGAKVNSKFVPISTKLKSGDTVSIITSKSAKPGKNWLSFMKSSRARQKVRSYFRNKELEDALRIGTEIFKKNCRKYHIKLVDENDEKFILTSLKINDMKSLYIKLGTGEILFQQIVDLLDNDKQIEPEIADVKKETESLEEQRKIAHGIRVEDIESLMLNYAKCCNPLPGDPIIGYVTRGKGITIHRKNCNDPSFINLQNRESERIIELEWNYQTQNTNQRKVEIRIIGKESGKIWIPILSVFSKYEIEIEKSNLKKADGKAIGYFCFFMNSEQETKILINKLKQIKDVSHIEFVKNQ